MNPSTAKGVVIGATAATAIIASVSDIATGSMPSVRVAVGATLAAAILYALAEPAPQLAAGFAMLMLLGAALSDGAEALKIINQAIGQN